MATFNTIELANGEVLVEGSDNNGKYYSTILNGREWEAILERENVDKAEDQFEDAVRDFFAPLTKAADVLDEAVTSKMDPDFYIVVSEETEAVEGKSACILNLSEDTVILRLLARGDYDRLQWAHINGADRILIIKASPVTDDEQGVVVPLFEDYGNGIVGDVS